MLPPSGSVLLPGGQITQEMRVKSNSPSVSIKKFACRSYINFINFFLGRPKNEVKNFVRMQWKSNFGANGSEQFSGCLMEGYICLSGARKIRFYLRI